MWRRENLIIIQDGVNEYISSTVISKGNYNRPFDPVNMLFSGYRKK